MAVNQPVDEGTAKLILEKLSFFEIMLAPSYSPEALKLFEAKKNLRVMTVEGLGTVKEPVPGHHLRRVEGGFLVQEFDQKIEDISLRRVVTRPQPGNELAKDLNFGWKVVKHVKSNAIVLVKDGVTIGVGAGQMNRVGSLAIAIQQAGEKAKGSVMASDALLPFRDSVDACAKAGIAAIIQTGGSVRDEEVIAAANEHGIAMMFTTYRHFKH